VSRCDYTIGDTRVRVIAEIVSRIRLINALRNNLRRLSRHAQDSFEYFDSEIFKLSAVYKYSKKGGIF